MEIEIYFDDLTKQTQDDILKALNIGTPEDANLDIIPLTSICIGE